MENGYKYARTMLIATFIGAFGTFIIICLLVVYMAALMEG